MDAAGVSSLRRLADLAGIAHTGATRVVHGDNLPNAETVEALAKALNVPASTIYKLTHGQKVEVRHWHPPAEVHRLTKREQDAVTEMIRVIASAHDQREDVGDDDSSAAISGAGGTPAEDDKVHHLSFEDEDLTEEERFGAAAAPEEKELRHDDPIDEQPL